PSHPRGTAHVELDDLVRSDTQLGQLTVDASNHLDGTIAVELRSEPKFAPLVIEADALVHPGTAIAIELERHHVRAYGTDWIGTGGRVVIRPDAIEVRDLASSAGEQKLALAGTLHRASGDFDASAAIEHLSLGALRDGARGQLDGRVDVVRKR